MRRMIRTILEKSDFLVVAEAESGEACVEQYRLLRPDIVTLDVTMPGMDGVQTLKALKQLDPHARVVMVSAMGQEGIVADAVANGAANFIVKPFREETLLAALKHTTAR